MLHGQQDEDEIDDADGHADAHGHDETKAFGEFPDDERADDAGGVDAGLDHAEHLTARHGEW